MEEQMILSPADDKIEDLKMDDASTTLNSPQSPPDVKELSFRSLLPDTGFNVEAQGVFEWKLENYSKIESKFYSPSFKVGDHQWNILVMPKPGDQIALYLNYDDPKKAENPKWSVCAQFSLVFCNPEDPTNFVHRDVHHRFTNEECDWGFPSFYSMKDNEIQNIFVNGCVTVMAFVKIIKDETGILWSKLVDWDSKKQTGFVGLKNQGATCYMNSLLQSLYFTNTFRKACFHIPTDSEDSSKSVALALQKVFYLLQNSNEAPGTNELTRSFGWDNMDSFMQHDIQEFSRVLQETLEQKMKNTKVEGVIDKLFKGTLKSYIRCVNVEYESSKEEIFYDLQLNVKSLKDLKASFDDYVLVESLDGDNKYKTEDYGLQDAKKGMIFVKLPPVLHLHLKRFDYDYERDTIMKINDRHEFPLEINLDEYIDKSVKNTVPQNYHLHAVLVHSGDFNGGHYCSFIRPTEEPTFFKFDDDRVTPVTLKEALNDNYGGDYELSNQKKAKRFTNAYMLVYMRENERKEVLAPITNDDIPKHILDRFEREYTQELARKKERELQHMYMNIKVITDEYLKENCHIDFYNYGDTENKLIKLKVKRDETLEAFKESLSAQTIAVEKYRLWFLMKRQNGTLRPDTPLVLTKESLHFPIERVFSRQRQNNITDVVFYAEYSESGAFETVSDSHAILFFKFYDHVERVLKFVGHKVIKLTDQVGDLIPFLNQLMGFKPDEELRIYEEIKPGMVEPVKLKSTFMASDLSHGDILCFQKELNPKEMVESQQGIMSMKTVPQYIEHSIHKLMVLLKPRYGDGESFELELSGKMNYDIVSSIVSKKLGTEPLKVRFTGHDALSNGPKTVIKRSPTLTLHDMLTVCSFHPAEILYYEKLEVSIIELENKKNFRLTILDENIKEKETVNLLLDKSATIIDVGQKLNLDHRRLYLLEVLQCKICKFFVDDETVAPINENGDLYIQLLPEVLKDSQKLIDVFHFSKDPTRAHGIPFKFALNMDEPFSVTKQRLQDLLAVNEKEFQKYKFYIASYNRTRLIADEEILASFDFSYSEALAIDHIDKSGKSTSRFVKMTVSLPIDHNMNSTNLDYLDSILNSDKAALHERFRALFTLKNLGGEKAIDIISKGFKDTSDLLKHELAYVLGQMKNEYAIEILSSVLDDETQGKMVRHECAESLGAIGNKRALDILKKHLKNEESVISETCELAIKLIHFGDENVAPTSIYSSIDPAPSLGDESVDTFALGVMLMNKKLPLFERYRAMFELRNRGGEAAVFELAKGFKDSSALFRHEISYVFGQLQHPASVPFLIERLNDEKEESIVRHESAEALGSIAVPECYEALKKFINDADRVVRESCIVAIDMYEYENSDQFQFIN